MSINIHPSAENNFNKKAAEFIDLIEFFPAREESNKSFPSELYVTHEIAEKCIIGAVDISNIDYKGNTTQSFFHLNGKNFGLNTENYKKLRELAEKIQSLPAIRQMLSCSFVEKTLFKWISEKYKGSHVTDMFIEYLDNEAKSVVKTIVSWIPIANLEVQSPFPVSKSEIRPLSKAVIENWVSKVKPLTYEAKEEEGELFKNIRKSYQGLAAVVTTITAEPEYAFDYAFEEAQKITDVLGIFSSAILIPDIKCLSRVKGSENITRVISFFETCDNNFNKLDKIIDQIIDKTSALRWRLDQSMIIEIQKTGLAKISSLMASETLTEFEQSVLNSIFLYSKAAFTSDPVEKVIYILSALESILLKNETEPIQQNLAERIAVFTSEKLDERKSIIKLTKRVYNIRSKYLHHGHNFSELDCISNFMMQVWKFYMYLLYNLKKFLNKNEFINFIDDHKLS